MQQLYIHPDNPQPRLISQAADAINKGRLIVYPTDTSYAFGCALGEKKAIERISQLRGLDNKHQFTLLCRDLSEIATFATVDNHQFRLLKNNTPAAITFILQATKEVPKRLAHPKKKTIGIRVPTNPIAQALLKAVNAPILTSTLILAHQEFVLDDPMDIEDHLAHGVDVFINGGIKTTKVTTIVDLTSDTPLLIRQGAAQVDNLLKG